MFYGDCDSQCFQDVIYLIEVLKVLIDKDIILEGIEVKKMSDFFSSNFQVKKGLKYEDFAKPNIPALVWNTQKQNILQNRKLS